MPDGQTQTPVPIRVKVLGAVEVRASERTLELPPLVRALVGVLAAHGGRSVSVERLADALWDGRPPPSCRNRVQAAVSTLRRSLTAVGVDQQLILTTPTGYALDPNLSFVDAAEFVALVDTARVHVASGEPETAIGVYRNALALWRGDAFDGVARSGIQAEAARLDELRLGAVEECVEAELATGQHANAVVELTRLVAQHPLRERLRGQLMLSLYRSGREAEALAVYRSGYDRMTAELGVEPGTDLQALHHAILTRQPRLSSSPGPATVAFAYDYPVPGQMPMSVPDFTGRRAEMTALQAHLVTRAEQAAAGSAVVVIAGMGGVGKTTLAVRARDRPRMPSPAAACSPTCGARPANRPTRMTSSARFCAHSAFRRNASPQIHRNESVCTGRSRRPGECW